MTDTQYLGLMVFGPMLLICIIAGWPRKRHRRQWRDKPWSDPRCSIRQFRNIVDTTKERQAR